MISGRSAGDAVLTSGMGRRAVQLLNEGGVKVYLLDGDNTRRAEMPAYFQEIAPGIMLNAFYSLQISLRRPGRHGHLQSLEKPAENKFQDNLKRMRYLPKSRIHYLERGRRRLLSGQIHGGIHKANPDNVPDGHAGRPAGCGGEHNGQPPAAGAAPEIGKSPPITWTFAGLPDRPR